MKDLLGFDKEEFQQSESTVFRHLKNQLDRGGQYCIDPEGENPFFFVEWAKYLLIFKMTPENFIFKKKLFSKEKQLKWDHLIKAAKNALEMSNKELQQSNVRITVLSLHDIFGRYTDRDFTRELRLQFEEANIENVFDKKFELDQFSSYAQLTKILNEADVDDPLYNEIKLEAKRVKKAYQEKRLEFDQELQDFHNRLRTNKQLSVLSQIVS